ncbi:hypothetical protein [Steroidobacter sp.]|uniref:hypothetical protein n=1 Tax=Steroidobacter sp. TaxID=1978227 RepID=UPI001A56FD49|nr:hypothetical protein [Steroidobacter sp.]MBL8266298.1 hypothetical protein [Steroidobacter sp.]
MSEQIAGVALRFGQRPTLGWVTDLSQVAEMFSTAPHLIVIGLAQHPGDLLKDACAQLLSEQAGEHGANSNLVLKLKSVEAFESAYSKYVVSGKQVEPKVIFIQSRDESASQGSFADELTEALNFLSHVSWADLPVQSLRARFANDEQLRLGRERRDQLLVEERWLNAWQVHEQQGGNANAHGVNNTASRARRLGEMLGAWNGREYLYPGFQFDLQTGRWMPEMKQLLDILPRDRSGWRQAFWLFQKHSRLDDRRPADIFQKEPSAVIEAARSDFVLDDERW